MANVEELRRRLEDITGLSFDRQHAIRELVRIGGPEACSALAPALTDPDPFVRREAARAAGLLCDASLVGALADRLGEEIDEPVRRAIVEALARSGGPVAQVALEGARADPSLIVRLAVERALAALPVLAEAATEARPGGEAEEIAAAEPVLEPELASAESPLAPHPAPLQESPVAGDRNADEGTAVPEPHEEPVPADGPVVQAASTASANDPAKATPAPEVPAGPDRVVPSGGKPPESRAAPRDAGTAPDAEGAETEEGAGGDEAVMERIRQVFPQPPHAETPPAIVVFPVSVRPVADTALRGAGRAGGNDDPDFVLPGPTSARRPVSGDPRKEPRQAARVESPEAEAPADPNAFEFLLRAHSGAPGVPAAPKAACAEPPVEVLPREPALSPRERPTGSDAGRTPPSGPAQPLVEPLQSPRCLVMMIAVLLGTVAVVTLALSLTR